MKKEAGKWLINLLDKPINKIEKCALPKRNFGELKAILVFDENQVSFLWTLVRDD